MKQENLILIIGATGGVGQQVVKLLQPRANQVRIMVRDVQKAQKMFGNAIDIVSGNVTQLDSLSDAMKNITGLICAIGSHSIQPPENPETIDYGGVKNLVHTAKKFNVARFVLVSSCMVTHPEHPLNKFGQVLSWKFKGEEVLRKSGLLYTIIRPGGLTDAQDAHQKIILDQGDKISGMISREEVAQILIHALDSPYSKDKTFEAISMPGKLTQDWDKLFQALKSD